MVTLSQTLCQALSQIPSVNGKGLLVMSCHVDKNTEIGHTMCHMPDAWRWIASTSPSHDMSPSHDLRCVGR
jgi:hypothetical protein